MKAKRNNNIILRCTWLLLTLLCVVPEGRADSDSIPVRPAGAEADDSVSYELPRPRNFNALRYTLDSQHRYLGDAMSKGNTFLDFGAGIIFLQHSNTSGVEPVTNLHLRLGRQFNSLHSARIGLSGGVGYMPSGLTGNGPQTLMGMIGGEADYLFSLSNYLLGYRPERPLELSGILGVGFNRFMIGGGNNKATAYDLKESSMSYNFHAGVQLKLFAGPHAAITAEPYVMLSNVKADLANQGSNWHRYHVAYGVNLSYIHYINNVLTPPALTGDFKKRFADGERWLRGDADDQAQRRPFFLHYGAGIAAYNTFTGLRWGKTIGPTASIGLGGWLSSAIGLRALVSATNGKWSKTDNQVNMIGYGAVAVDAVLNPLGFSRHYDWEAPAGLNFFGGYEFGMLKMVNMSGRNRSNVIGYRLGMQPWVRLRHDTRFYIEPMYTFLRHRQGEENRKRDDQVSLMAGIELLLGNRQDSPSDGSLVMPSGYFVGLGGGWNTTVRKWKYRDNTDTPFKNALLFGGYRFDPYNGVIISEEYLTDKVLRPSGELKWENWMTSIGYQLNISNLLTGWQPDKHWNVSVMLGPAMAVNSVKTRFGVYGALQLDYQLSKHFALFYQHRLYWMDRHLYESDQLYNQAGTVISSMNVGLMYQFEDLVGPTVRVAKGTAHGISVASRAVAHGVGNLFKQQRSPFFLDYGYGVAWIPDMPAKGGDSWGPSMQLAAGWWMIPAVGLRAGVNVAKGGALSLTAREANALHDLVTATAYGSFFADVMVNPLGFVSNYNWDQPFGVSLIAGVHKGIMAMEGYNSEARGRDLYASGWRAGMQLWVKLQDDLRLHVEPMYTRLSCDEIYLDEAHTTVSRTPAEGYSLFNAREAMSVRIGLTALLRSPKQRAASGVEPGDRSRFFAAVGGGMNFAFNKWRYADGGLNVNALLYGGYNFNEYHALRAQAEYVSDDMAKAGQEAERTRVGLFSLDYQLDVTSLFSGYQPQRRWELALFAGPSATDRMHIGLNGGLNVGYRLDSHWGLFYNHNVYMFSDADMLRTEQISGRWATLSTVNLGVKYHF